MFLAAIAMMIAVEFVEEFYLVGFQPTGTSWFIPAWLQSWDIAGFELVHESLTSPFLDIAMWLITRTGSTVFWLLLAAVLWLARRKRQAALLVFGVIVGGVLLLPVKILLRDLDHIRLCKGLE